MKITFNSPNFPRFYPDNLNCLSFIVAPSGYRILIEFEELVLEHEPQCAYDYLELFEPTQELSTSMSPESGKVKMQNQISEKDKFQQLEYETFLKDYSQQRPRPTFIFQPSNVTYNKFSPPPRNLSSQMPRRICGDWSSRLKLLRYQTTSNLLGINFSSDYSHHFSGFKTKISLEKGKIKAFTANRLVV